MRCGQFVVLCVVIFLVTEMRAYAYADPGSGALIWQILVGASIGVMFYLRAIIRWVRGLKANRKANENAFPSETEKEPGPTIL
jgi:hypothetical protein